MVEEDFRFHTKLPEQHFLVFKAEPGQIPHGVDVYAGKVGSDTWPDLPKIRQWLIAPKFSRKERSSSSATRTPSLSAGMCFAVISMAILAR